MFDVVTFGEAMIRLSPAAAKQNAGPSPKLRPQDDEFCQWFCQAGAALAESRNRRGRHGMHQGGRDETDQPGAAGMRVGMAAALFRLRAAHRA